MRSTIKPEHGAVGGKKPRNTDICPPEETEPWDFKPRKRRQQRIRKPTLRSLSKQAAKAGIAVAAFEVHSDGKISIVLGKSVPGVTTDDGYADEWD